MSELRGKEAESIGADGGLQPGKTGKPTANLKGFILRSSEDFQLYTEDEIVLDSVKRVRIVSAAEVTIEAPIINLFGEVRYLGDEGTGGGGGTGGGTGSGSGSGSGTGSGSGSGTGTGGTGTGSGTGSGTGTDTGTGGTGTDTTTGGGGTDTGTGGGGSGTGGSTVGNFTVSGGVIPLSGWPPTDAGSNRLPLSFSVSSTGAARISIFNTSTTKQPASSNITLNGALFNGNTTIVMELTEANNYTANITIATDATASLGSFTVTDADNPASQILRATWVSGDGSLSWG